jgi:hypothetical protein
MRALLSLIFLGVVLYLGYYVWQRLTPDERNKVVNVSKESLDKVGDKVTEGAKEVLKKVPERPAASSPAK